MSAQKKGSKKGNGRGRVIRQGDDVNTDILTFGFAIDVTFACIFWLFSTPKHAWLLTALLGLGTAHAILPTDDFFLHTIECAVFTYLAFMQTHYKTALCLFAMGVFQCAMTINSIMAIEVQIAVDVYVTIYTFLITMLLFAKDNHNEGLYHRFVDSTSAGRWLESQFSVLLGKARLQLNIIIIWCEG